MGHVAMNTLATLMQNSFSNYQTSFVGSSGKDFSQILSMKTSASASHAGTYKSQAVNALERNVSKLEARDESRQTIETTDQTSLKGQRQMSEDDTKVETETNKVQETKEGNKAEKAETSDSKLLNKEDVKTLKEAAKEVLDQVAKELDMNPEEVMDLLADLGMTVMDLFDMDQLKLFLSESMDLSNPLELLTTDGGTEKLAELMETVEAVKEDHPEAIKILDMLKAENAEINMVKTEDFMKMLNNFQDTTGGEQSGQSESGDSQLTGLTSESASGKTEVQGMTSGFEGALNQVVTEKTDTIVMNGQVMTIRTEVTAKDVFDQIVTAMKVQVSESKSDVLLQLNPQNLGKIGVQLTNENGIVTGHFVAESEAVKEVIEANLASLKTQLQNQGIDVTEIKITVGNASQFLAGQGDRQSASGNNQGRNNKKHGSAKVNGIFADNSNSETQADERIEVNENSSIELHA